MLAKCANKLEDIQAVTEDWFYYLQDILELKIEKLSRSLITYLMDNFFYPVLFNPLHQYQVSKSLLSKSDKEEQVCAMNTIVSLVYLLNFLRIINDKSLVKAIVIALFHPLTPKSREMLIESIYKATGFSSKDCADTDSDNKPEQKRGFKFSNKRSCFARGKSLYYLHKNREFRILSNDKDDTSSQGHKDKIDQEKQVLKEATEEVVQGESTDNVGNGLDSLTDSISDLNVQNKQERHSKEELEPCDETNQCEQSRMTNQENLQVESPIQDEELKNIDTVFELNNYRSFLLDSSLHQNQKIALLSSYLVHHCFLSLSKSVIEKDVRTGYGDDYGEEVIAGNNVEEIDEFDDTLSPADLMGLFESLGIFPQDLCGYSNYSDVPVTEDILNANSMGDNKYELDVNPNFLNVAMLKNIMKVLYTKTCTVDAPQSAISSPAPSTSSNILSPASNALTNESTTANFVQKLFAILQNASQFSLTILQVTSHTISCLICLLQKVLSTKSDLKLKNLDSSKVRAKLILENICKMTRDCSRQSALNLKESILDIDNDILLNMIDDEIGRYKGRKWSTSMPSLLKDSALFFPPTQSNLHQMGVDYNVPVSHMELVKKDFHTFLLLRALYKQVYTVILLPENEIQSLTDDLCSTINDKSFLSINASNIVPKSLAPASPYEMAGKRFLESFISPSYWTTDKNLEDNSPTSPTGGLSFSSYFSRGSGGSKSNATNTPEGTTYKRLSGSFFGSRGSDASSNSGRRKSNRVSKGVNSMEEAQFELQEKNAQQYGVLFVQDPSLLLLISQERLDLKRGFKVYIVAPLLYTTAMTDIYDNRSFNVCVRSIDTIPHMQKSGKESGSEKKNQSIYRSSPTYLVQETKNNIWKVSVTMDTEKACKLAVKFVNERRKVLVEEAMTRLTQLLDSWASSKEVVPKSD